MQAREVAKELAKKLLAMSAPSKVHTLKSWLREILTSGSVGGYVLYSTKKR
jgi:hypothetical protein